MINTSISGALASDFGLDAAEMGLLASVYFLVFAGAQIPVGVFLDRFGPRRVQSVLLIVAAGGTTLFGTATGFVELLVARAMIGLGVAAALMAGLKAIVIWFPKERIALVNGCMIMLGSLGAVTATAPAEWLLDWMGWRGLFEVLTFATIAAAGLIYFAVPERDTTAKGSTISQNLLTLRSIYSDPRFLRIAPLSATCIGSSWALQSLWAGPWLADVEGFDRQSLIIQLFIMALGISVGALLMGTIADRLRRRGAKTEVLFAIVAALFVGAELVLIWRLPLPSLLPWSIVSVVGAGTVLSYAIIAEYFPIELAARANGCLNVFHFGWAFVVQYGTGLILQQWSAQDGHYPAMAYQAAFALNAALQTVALVWFIAPWLRSLSWRVAKSFFHEPANHRGLVEPVIPLTEIATLQTQEGVEW